MAKKWIPPDIVGQNEQIGRRLFDEPKLAGTNDQPSFDGLRLNHFEEKRDNMFSVDRLGASGINRNTKNYLQARAERAGTNFSTIKRFDGWATLRAKELSNSRKPPNLSLIASPISKPENGADLDENIYHAHIPTPDNMNSYMVALHLRNLFTTYGKVEASNASAANVSMFKRIIESVRRVLSKILGGRS